MIQVNKVGAKKNSGDHRQSAIGHRPAQDWNEEDENSGNLMVVLSLLVELSKKNPLFSIKKFIYFTTFIYKIRTKDNELYRTKRETTKCT
jgi:hypothetical protein